MKQQTQVQYKEDTLKDTINYQRYSKDTKNLFNCDSDQNKTTNFLINKSQRIIKNKQLKKRITLKTNPYKMLYLSWCLLIYLFKFTTCLLNTPYELNILSKLQNYLSDQQNMINLQFSNPSPLSRGKTQFNFTLETIPKILVIQLFDNIKLNELRCQLTGYFSETLNLLQLVNKQYQIDLQTSSFYDEFALQYFITFDTTNMSNQNMTSGDQLLQIIDSNNKKVTIRAESFYTYQETQQCKYFESTIVSENGFHQKGELKFDFDLPVMNKIFDKNDYLLFAFSTEQYLNKDLIKYPSSLYTGIYPFDNLNEVEVEIQINSQSKPLKVAAYQVNNKFVLVEPSPLFNSDGTYQQRFSITISNIILPALNETKFYSQTYLTTKEGYYKCYVPNQLKLNKISPFKKFDVVATSNDPGLPTIFKFQLQPQRYLVPSNISLEIEFSSNFDIPSSKNALKIFDMQNFITDSSSFAIENRKITFNNFTTKFQNNTVIKFSIEGITQPIQREFAQITARNVYNNTYYQHQSVFSYNIIQSGQATLTIDNQSISQKASYTFKSKTPFDIPKQGKLQVYMPYEYFGKLQDNSIPKDFSFQINSSPWLGKLTIQDNIYTIEFSYTQNIVANTQISLTFQDIRNYQKTDQVTQSIFYSIVDASSIILAKYQVQTPKLQEGIVQLKSWIALNNNLNSMNNIEISFQVPTSSYEFDGFFENSIKIYISSFLQVTNETSLIFVDKSNQTDSQKLQWKIENQIIEIKGFTLLENTLYYIILSNILNPRTIQTINTPRIETFGKSVLIHSILEGKNDISFSVDQPSQIVFADFTLGQSNMVNFLNNTAVINLFLGQKNILPGDYVLIFLDKQLNISQLTEIVINSDSIQQNIKLALEQFKIDSLIDPSYNIIQFLIPNDIKDQQINNNIQFLLQYIQNPIYKCQIQYKVFIKNSLEQIIYQTYNLIFDDLDVIKINQASITFNGQSQNKKLGESYNSTFLLSPEISLPSSGIVKISGFGNDIKLNNTEIQLFSQQNFKIMNSSVVQEHQIQILLFKYEDMYQIDNQIEIFIQGLQTNQINFSSKDELQIQIYDSDTGERLVTQIFNISVDIQNLECEQKCITCFINAQTCIKFSLDQNNSNNANSNGTNNNNNNTNNNGSNNNNNTNVNNTNTDTNNGSNNNHNNSTNNNNSSNNNNINQENKNTKNEINNKSNEAKSQTCNSIKGCFKCDIVDRNKCIECSIGYQLETNTCIKLNGIEHNLTLMSSLILLSVGIALGATLIWNSIRVEYLILQLWVSIEIYGYVLYIKSYLSHLFLQIQYLKILETTKIQITQIVLFTLIIIFYLICQTFFMFLRREIMRSQILSKQSCSQTAKMKVIIFISQIFCFFEFRYFYILNVSNNEDQQNNLSSNNKVFPSDLNLTSNSLCHINIDNNNQKKSSNKLIMKSKVQTSSQLNTIQQIQTKQHSHAQFYDIYLSPLLMNRQSQIFILSSIQNIFKIAIICIDLTQHNKEQTKVFLVEFLIISLLILINNVILIINFFKLIKKFNKVVPINSKNNLNLLKQQSNEVPNNINIYDNKQEYKSSSTNQFSPINQKKINIGEQDSLKQNQNNLNKTIETERKLLIEQIPPQKSLRRRRNKINIIRNLMNGDFKQ